LYAFLCSPLHATCSPILSSLTIFYKEYKLEKSSLCNLVHCVETSSLFKFKHSPDTLFSDILCCFLKVSCWSGKTVVS
jgi:hypothetical protein